MKKIIAFLLICSAFMLSLSTVKASEYEEIYDLNNGWIDGNRDAKYELIHNSSSELIYFSHSASRYAFYIESSELISQIKINSTTINSNVSNANIIAKIIGNRTEIVIQKSYLGGNVAFLISVNAGSLILLDPLGALIPPPPPIDTTTTETITETNTTTNATTGIDLVAFFENLGNSGVFWFFLFLIALYLADYNNHPEVWVQDISGTLIKLGRFIAETDEPTINKKKFLFANTGGIHAIYCDYSFRALDIFRRQRIYVIIWDYPHLTLTKHKIPESVKLMQKDNKDLKKYWQNYFIYFLFFFMRFTPFRFAAINLYNKLKSKEIRVTEVDFLIPSHCMESIEYRYDVEYEQCVLNPETMVEEWKKTEKKNILYSQILALDKMKIQKLNYLKVVAKNIKYATLKEALEDRNSRGELVNTYEFRMTELEIKNFDLEKQIQAAYSTIQKQRLETDEKIRNALKPYEEYAEYLRQTLPEMLSAILKLRARGISEQKALEIVVLEQMEKGDKEKEQLKIENIRLQTKLDKSSNKKVEIYNPNVISVKNEKTEKEKNGEDDE